MDTETLKIKALEFYNSLGFKIEESAPLQHDFFPMSFNMSAGFVQLEPYIHAKKAIKNPKIVTVQKCIRHFDLNKAGFDKSHLTFFEMWGALTLGTPNRFELLSNIYKFFDALGLDKSRLFISIFGGDTIHEKYFEQDEEAINIWQELGVNKTQIILGNRNNTFWFQGGNDLDDKTKGSPFEERLCGLQTEIFFDKTQKPCSDKCDVFCSCERWLEIANNLNITHQFNPQTQIFQKLVIPATETVFGVERLLSILQKKSSVWEISSLNPSTELLRNIVDLEDDHLHIIIDRLRPLLFLSLEGLPVIGKNGRHRIMRKLVRDTLSRLYLISSDQKIIAETLQKVLQNISKSYINSYPSLGDQIDNIVEYVTEHNEIYQETIRHAKSSIHNAYLRGEFTKIDQNLLKELSKRLGMPKFLIEKEFPNLIGQND